MLGQILVLWIRDHLPLELEVARKEVYRGFEARYPSEKETMQERVVMALAGR